MFGYETNDDAAVYAIDEHTTAVLTLDFITPVVDDPYEFGAIAAANALSDVFAMGATPRAALNILSFPSALGKTVVADVLRGGADKVREAGASIVGGHSMEDNEPKYGLAVFGVVDPDRLVRNVGAEVGDVLFYTASLGTGILTSAAKRHLISKANLRPAIATMMELNSYAARAMRAVPVHAATDVTGFGLAGHMHEMLLGSGVAAVLDWEALPLLDRVYEQAVQGHCPGRTREIVRWAVPFVDGGAVSTEEHQVRMNVLCDPQTSGGLLVAVPPHSADAFAAAFRNELNRDPARIGEVTNGSAGTIVVR